MSEGPFRGDAEAREARIAALEEENARLREKPAPLGSKERAKLEQQVVRLTNENRKLRKRVESARPTRTPLTDSNAILQWSVGALLAAAMIIGAAQNCSLHP